MSKQTLWPDEEQLTNNGLASFDMRTLQSNVALTADPTLFENGSDRAFGALTRGWSATMRQSQNWMRVTITYQNPSSIPQFIADFTSRIDYSANWKTATNYKLYNNSTIPNRFGNNNDLIYISRSNVTLINTAGGNDFLITVRRDTRLDAFLGDGNDLAIGGWNSDTIRGESGNDYINGCYGNDWIDGGAGDDTLDGSDGDDTLYGGDGDDMINGGDGQDSIFCGKGSDVLTGGRGNDIFYFYRDNYKSGLSKVTITDFGNGKDLIDLTSFKLAATGDSIQDKRFTLFSQNGHALLAFNLDQKPDLDLTILVDGMSYKQFTSGRDSYMKYLLV